MDLKVLLSFLVAMVFSLVFVPAVRWAGNKLDIIALVNERTVHKGRIVRIGGLGIYLSFLITSLIFLNTDNQINAIMIGGFITFMMGLADDMNNLSPKVKLLVQILAASVIIFYGKICLRNFNIPFCPQQVDAVISIIVTYFWIIGVTNAINLIDGLDGLCSGICIIALFTISIISLTFGRTDIASLSLLLAGAIAGFLYYNYYPASIFMGDCGTQFIGFVIATISLLGFGYKSSLFFSLGAPIVVLIIPIMDTLIAIIRRKLKGQSFSHADKGHLHHQLMFNLNNDQRKCVLILWGATALFSLDAFVYLYNRAAAYGLFMVLMLIFEIFVEKTKMISRHYRPLLATLNIFLQKETLPSFTKGDDSVMNLLKKRISSGRTGSRIGVLENKMESKVENKVEEEKPSHD